MSITRIQKGDNVKVISGKYKGHTGTVTAVRRSTDKKNYRVAVSGVATIAKFQKANRQYEMPGSMKQIERFLDSSNVALVDYKGNVSKVAIETSKDGKKFRAYKTTGKPVVKAKVESKSAKSAEDKSETKKTTKKTAKKETDAK